MLYYILQKKLTEKNTEFHWLQRSTFITGGNDLAEAEKCIEVISAFV